MSNRKDRLIRPGRSGQVSGMSIDADPLTISMTEKVIKVNLANLPSPTNVYDADAWTVRREAGFVALYFGQLDGDHMRSRLRLKYASEQFLSIFWKQSREFHKGLRDTVAALPADPLFPKPRDISGEKAEREHSAWVNFDYMSRSGSQASFDFYYLPTAGLARFVTGKGTNGLVLHPIARVTTTIHHMVGLLDACEALVPEVRQYLPAEEPASPDTSAPSESQGEER